MEHQKRPLARLYVDIRGPKPKVRLQSRSRRGTYFTIASFEGASGEPVQKLVAQALADRGTPG